MPKQKSRQQLYDQEMRLFRLGQQSTSQASRERAYHASRAAERYQENIERSRTYQSQNRARMRYLQANGFDANTGVWNNESRTMPSNVRREHDRMVRVMDGRLYPQSVYRGAAKGNSAK